MRGFAIILIAFGVIYRSVTAENSLQTYNEEAKHSPVFFLTVKLIDDVYELKKEIVELKSEKSKAENEDSELNEQISELQIEIVQLKSEISDITTKSKELASELQANIDDLKSENNGLKLEVSGLTAVIAEQEDTIELLESKFINYEAERQDRKESGATYVRWGRTECPSGRGTVKIYDGFAAGDHYTHAGGGVDLLCLPRQPSWGNYSSSHISHAYVYGTEYEIAGENSRRLFGKDVHQQNVPCVVCQSVGRLVALRIPGRSSCYTGWTEEYRGYLFAGHHGYAKSTDYTCVDSDPEFILGKHKNQNGRLLYPVEAACGDDSLPCPPYQDGWELACVICTK